MEDLPPDRVAGSRRSSFTSVTEHRAVIRALQGPKAREILTPLVSDSTSRTEAMPHMSVREGFGLCGVPTRADARLLHRRARILPRSTVPADYGRAVWTRCGPRADPTASTALTAPRPCTCCRRRRASSSSAQETDGTVGRPTTFGLLRHWFFQGEASDFVGKRSLALSRSRGARRKQLVGSRHGGSERAPRRGRADRHRPGLPPTPMRCRPRFTSSYVSPARPDDRSSRSSPTAAPHGRDRPQSPRARLRPRDDPRARLRRRRAESASMLRDP